MRRKINYAKCAICGCDVVFLDNLQQTERELIFHGHCKKCKSKCRLIKFKGFQCEEWEEA